MYGDQAAQTGKILSLTTIMEIRDSALLYSSVHKIRLISTPLV